MENDLTNQDFWVHYWSNLKLPISVDEGFKNDHVIAQEILNTIAANPNYSALEIGCAPGKWLSFLARKLQCNVTGIEYVPAAANKTVENLTLQNIKDFKIITGDFFQYSTDEKYDIVLSLGFIEHFDDFEGVLAKQLSFVAPEGYLIVGIPRFIGINYYMQKIIDKKITNKLLPAHNLKTMNLEVYKKFAKKNDLKIMSNRYIGGFERGLFPVAEIENFPYRVFCKIIMRALDFLFGNINSKFTSSYQIAILKK